MQTQQAYRGSLFCVGNEQVVPPQRQYPSGKTVIASALLLRAIWKEPDRQILVGSDYEEDALLSHLVECFGVMRVLYGLDTQTLLDMADTVVPPEGE